MNKVFKTLRNVIYIYLRRLYQTDILNKLNAGGFCSLDDSLFNHKNNNKIWILYN